MTPILYRNYILLPWIQIIGECTLVWNRRHGELRVGRFQTYYGQPLEVSSLNSFEVAASSFHQRHWRKGAKKTGNLWSWWDALCWTLRARQLARWECMYIQHYLESCHREMMVVHVSEYQMQSSMSTIYFASCQWSQHNREGICHLSDCEPCSWLHPSTWIRWSTRFKWKKDITRLAVMWVAVTHHAIAELTHSFYSPKAVIWSR